MLDGDKLREAARSPRPKEGGRGRPEGGLPGRRGSGEGLLAQEACGCHRGSLLHPQEVSQGEAGLPEDVAGRVLSALGVRDVRLAAEGFRLGDEDSGLLILERMRQKGLSLKDLSERAGVPAETLRRFLRLLPLSKQLKLAEELARIGAGP